MAAITANSRPSSFPSPQRVLLALVADGPSAFTRYAGELVGRLEEIV
jgi:hypothetical protein